MKTSILASIIITGAALSGAGIAFVVASGNDTKESQTRSSRREEALADETKKVSLLTSSATSRSDIPADQLDFFEKKIRPVLVDSCYECHSKESGRDKGGLVLDTRVGLRQGGSQGAGVVPFKPDESVLMKAITWSDSDLEMPPEQKLPAHVIADFRKWIVMGAPDPRDGGTPKVVNTEIDIEVGRKFWSFQKPQPSAPPAVDDAEWAKTDVDKFVFAKLREKGMKPAGVAESTDLLRRLSYDLTGLPPTAAMAGAFQADWERNPESAIASLADKLLGSPQFGERWGRHWLDVARFSESNGKSSNSSYPYAWRYRNYVIDAFNSDKPYDQFIEEQLAGDIRRTKSLEERQEGYVATGFLAMGPKDLSQKNRVQFQMDVVDDQINTTMLAFQGLTVACARCHDHKFDPIPTADYYALAGIFMSTKTFYGVPKSKYNSGTVLDLPIVRQTTKRFSAAEIAKLKARMAELKSSLGKMHQDKKARMKAVQKARDSGDPSMSGMKANTRSKAKKRSNAELDEIRALLDTVGQDGLQKDKAMAVLDQSELVHANVLVRGEVDSPAQQIRRGFLQVMNHSQVSVPENRSGRLELAQWITSRDNPLTARVAVNRVWAKLFGEGLVSTTENFGKTGLPPTHPKLLDHLALQFMTDGWSMKTLVRRLVLTRAYRMSTDFNPANYEIDPDNKLLWRATSRRLDGEAIRDSILAVSGQLDLKRPASAMMEFGDGELSGKGVPNLTLNTPPYRSIYVPVVREKAEQLIELFDGADANLVTGHRKTSNVAGQALYMMNSEFILKHADAFAANLRQRHSSTKDRINNGFLSAFGRLPTANEFKASIEFYNRFQAAALRDSGSRTMADAMFLSAFCQGLFSSAEFRYLN